MGRRKLGGTMGSSLLTANHAAALAATLAGRANRSARGFGSAVYPITPQSEAIELLCAQSFDRGDVVRVESEHSAMGACIGLSQAGLRCFTASSSNGLAFMAENVFVASAYRLPIVMLAVNRALGPPWNIWVDHGDTLALRDSGWLQLYCEDNQEVLDTVLAAFRLAEDPRVLLPVMVCQDAFVLSHTATQVDVPTQAVVDAFLPPLDLPHRITTEPRAVGQLDPPRELQRHRQQMCEAMDRARSIHREIEQHFEALFGRSLPGALCPYRLDDAEVALVCMGTMAAAAREAVDQARQLGVRAGMVRVRMLRPFPEPELRAALCGLRRIAVVDRDVGPGLGGVLWSELRALVPHDGVVQGYVAGLGGGDVRPEHLRGVLEEVRSLEAPGAPRFVEVSA